MLRRVLVSPKLRYYMVWHCFEWYGRNSREVVLCEFLMAERTGFEPAVGVTHTRFPGVPVKPLRHLSALRGCCL